MFSFHPHQVGVFNTTQLIEILGPVSAEDAQDLSLCVLTPIHTIYIPLTGESKPVTKTVPLKYNPGITPLICNEVRTQLFSECPIHFVCKQYGFWALIWFFGIVFFFFSIWNDKKCMEIIFVQMGPQFFQTFGAYCWTFSSNSIHYYDSLGWAACWNEARGSGTFQPKGSCFECPKCSPCACSDNRTSSGIS